MSKKKYAVDTNVLIDDPQCISKLYQGGENSVFIPLTVLLELDRLKTDDRIGHKVRAALTEVCNFVAATPEALINGSISSSPNTKYIGDTSLIEDIKAVTGIILVTNDRVLQIRAQKANIRSEPYLWSVPLGSESQLLTGELQDGEEPTLPNMFRVIDAQTQAFRFYKTPTEYVDVEKPIHPWKIDPTDVYQNVAIHALLDPSIKIVSLQSEAGKGKTFLALAVALALTRDKSTRRHDNITFIKSNLEIGEKIGYLPGEIEDKLGPHWDYVRTIMNTLDDKRGLHSLRTTSKVNLGFDPKQFELTPIQYLRGRSILDSFVIIDESQNIPRTDMRSILTRIGTGSKVVILGDVRQVDNPYLNEHNNGINWVVKCMSGNPKYAHFVLKGSAARGEICNMVLESGL